MLVPCQHEWIGGLSPIRVVSEQSRQRISGERAAGCQKQLHPVSGNLLHTAFVVLQWRTYSYNERVPVQRKTLSYWAETVKLCGRPAAITVGDAAVTGEVTCGFPAEST